MPSPRTFLLLFVATAFWPEVLAWIVRNYRFRECRGGVITFAATEPTTEHTATRLNPLLDSIQPSKTVEIFSLVKQMQAEGIDVTSLCVGEPDYPPPQAVLDAILTAVKDGQTRYTAVTGTLELRQAIADDLKSRKGVSYDPLTEIVVGNGAKQSVFQGIMAVAGVGDEVLVPAPHWPYPEMVKLTGATPVIVNTQPETGYLLTGDELRQTLTKHPKIKMVIICNPSNPTGGVYGQEQLSDLVRVLQDFPSVAILSDEIYERLVYEGDCPSFAAQPGMFDRTITINGFSKSHAMTGLRIGYLAAPSHIAKAASKIQSQLTSCAGSLSQAAGVAALTQVEESELEKNVVIMKEKRDYVLKRLAGMPNVRVAVPPNGAFYVLPDLSSFGDDAALCMDLLKSEKLALVPGTSFGAPGTVRISYATSMDELETAMNKLEKYLRGRLDNA
jgi:aspartate/methionine/tyrosine aminotransferase